MVAHLRFLLKMATGSMLFGHISKHVSMCPKSAARRSKVKHTSKKSKVQIACTSTDPKNRPRIALDTRCFAVSHAHGADTLHCSLTPEGEESRRGGFAQRELGGGQRNVVLEVSSVKDLYVAAMDTEFPSRLWCPAFGGR